MTGLDCLKKILPHLEEYCGQKPAGAGFDVLDFSRWLGGNEKRRRARGGPNTARRAPGGMEARVKASHLLLQWSRLARFYIKKGLEGSPLSIPEDFEYLHFLQHVPSMTKSELILHHNMEMPSGIEIIKRLLKKGLIEESADSGDRRSHRVRITGKGSREVKKLLPRSLQVFALISRPLSREQAGLLAEVLVSLVGHHEGVFKRLKKPTFPEVRTAVCKTKPPADGAHPAGRRSAGRAIPSGRPSAAR